MNVREMMHFVKGLAPAADRWNTNPATDIVKLDEWNKAVFLVHQQGGTTGVATLTVEACSDNTGTGATAVAFAYAVGADGAGANSDIMGARTEAAAAGFNTTAAIDALYLIEIRGDQLPDGKPYVRLKCTEAVNDPVNGAVEIMLYEGRFIGDAHNSVIN